MVGRVTDSKAKIIAACGFLATTGTAQGQTPVVPLRSTPVLLSYDDAPRTPDADDPAIWLPPRGEGPPYILGTLKNAGIAVYDLEGHEVQHVLPPRRPPIASTDPPAPGQVPDSGTEPCEESTSRAYGRFNNVDIAYHVPVPTGTGVTLRDLAIVTDTGCDQLRIYALVPGRPGGPLVDMTADVPGRVFPRRYVQPWSALGGGMPYETNNPLDDRNTAYGVAVGPREGGRVHVFVSQRHRAVVAELVLVPMGDGRMGYEHQRDYRFPERFALAKEPKNPGRASEANPGYWSPCREDPSEDPQLEGLVYDEKGQRLLAGQEVVGIYAVPVVKQGHKPVHVAAGNLMDRVRTFGEPYRAEPRGAKYVCQRGLGTTPKPGELVGVGGVGQGGVHLEADVEGLALYESGDRSMLLVSSQGDDTFHLYDITQGSPWSHRSSFVIEGVGATDGHALLPRGLPAPFGEGLLVVQNGKVVLPVSVPSHGTALDHATRFELIPWNRIPH